MDSLSQKRILAAYRMRVAPIEELFAMGKIGPEKRREYLEHARDLAGVTEMRTAPVVISSTGVESDEERERRFLRRREGGRRRNARKRAASGQAMGGADAR